jgi:glycosyltransferase involved in cell wall biosynthesis
MNNVCVIIPVYNHSATIGAVIEGVLGYGLKVFVVDDGSTDHLQSVLQEFDGKISVISYSKNRGKGYALQRGFEAARKAGYDYSLTLDADGQHRSEDIALLLNEIEKHPHSLILGSRSLNHENMPSQNSFANHLSNFWFTVQTGKRLSDTQTGFRVYPLQQMKKIRLVTSRYETELELLVRLAWKRIDIVPVKINVYYPPQNERVSHFRPVIDFFRISMLNTALIVLASFYGYPRILIHQLTGFFKSGGIIHRTTLNVVSFLCSVYALIGLTISCLFATVAGFFLFTVGTPTDAKKAWYHNLLFRSMHFFQKYIPRVKVEMRGMENLSSLENRPAVIISNHQSHLDLMCVIALHPKLILVTKE